MVNSQYLTLNSDCLILSAGHHYESDLDVKIRKIKENNDQIMRRKRQIEEDKKKYG